MSASTLGIAFGRLVGYTPDVMKATGSGYWYWRHSLTRVDDRGEPCVEVAHTVDDCSIVCSGSSLGRAARIANALNRVYGYVDAPVYDEDTGHQLRRR